MPVRTQRHQRNVQGPAMRTRSRRAKSQGPPASRTRSQTSRRAQSQGPTPTTESNARNQHGARAQNQTERTHARTNNSSNARGRTQRHQAAARTGTRTTSPNARIQHDRSRTVRTETTRTTTSSTARSQQRGQDRTAGSQTARNPTTSRKKKTPRPSPAKTKEVRGRAPTATNRTGTKTSNDKKKTKSTVSGTKQPSSKLDRGDFIRQDGMEPGVLETLKVHGSTKLFLDNDVREVGIPNGFGSGVMTYLGDEGVLVALRRFVGPDAPYGNKKRFKIEEATGWIFHRVGVPKVDNGLHSDIVWIYPSSKDKCIEFLKTLGEHGLPEILRKVPRFLKIDSATTNSMTYTMIGLVALSFKGPSEPRKMHVDMPGTCDKMATVLLPLKLPKLKGGTPPELVLQKQNEQNENVQKEYKYREDRGIVMKAGVEHNTNSCENGDDFRLMIQMYVGDYEKKDVDAIKKSVEWFPPGDKVMAHGKDATGKGAMVWREENKLNFNDPTYGLID